MASPRESVAAESPAEDPAGPRAAPEELAARGAWKMVVRVRGLRGLPKDLATRLVFCKLSLNNALHKTAASKVVEDPDTGLGMVTFAGQTYRDWSVSRPSQLSFEDLLVVRVKHQTLLGMSAPVGVVSIALRAVSELGTPEGRAWFPLAPYEKMKTAQGEICLSIYWTMNPVEEALSPLELSHLDEVAVEGPLSGSSARSRQSSRSSKGIPGLSLHVPGLHSPQLGRFKNVLSRPHKTQEALIRSGATAHGLDLEAEGVSVEGTWRTDPLLDNEMEAQWELAGDALVFEAQDESLGAPTRNVVFSPDVDHQASEHFISRLPSEASKDSGTRASSMDSVEDLATPPTRIAGSRRPTLLLEIIEGRGLLAADSNGLSDPYCIVRLKNSKRKTKVVQKSLTPYWGETLIFGGDENPKELVSLDDLVTIIVKDRDLLGFDDDLGRVELPLWAIASHHHHHDLDEEEEAEDDDQQVNTDEEFDEREDEESECNDDDDDRGRTGGQDAEASSAGSLKERETEADGTRGAPGALPAPPPLKEEDDAELALDGFDTGRFDAREDDLHSDALPSPPAQPDSPRSVLSSSSGKSFTSQRSTRSLFNLGTVKARLETRDGPSGKVAAVKQPHARFRRFQSINAQVVNTRAKWYSLSCSPGMTTVRGEIKIRISFFAGVAEDDTLDEFAKIARLPTQELHLKGSIKKLLSRDSQLEDSLDNYRARVPRYATAHTVLHVRVIQARNIIAADANGKSDPYAVVTVRKSSRRTPIKKKTLNPVWNVLFEFGKGQEIITEMDEILVAVKDYDRLLRDDDLGYVSIPFWSFIGCDSGPEWYSLKRKNSIPRFNKSNETSSFQVRDQAMQDLGEVQLHITFTVDNPAVERPLSKLDPRHHLLRHDATTRDVLDTVAAAKQAQYKLYNGKVWFFKMRVHVIGASGLGVAGKGHDGQSNPTFVTVTCAEETRRTKTIKGTTNPMYKERFEFTKSSVPGALGLCRQDRLLITVRRPTSGNTADRERVNSGQQETGKDKIGGQILAVTTIDVGYLMDKMGYIDRDGKQVHAWFDLERIDAVPMGPLENMRRALADMHALDSAGSLADKQSKAGGHKDPARIRLAIELHPTSESRLMPREKLVVRINRAKGLDESSREKTQRNIFVRAMVSSNQQETSLCKMIHGHVVVHEELYFASLDPFELHELLHIFVCLEQTGEPVAHFSYPLQDLREQPDAAIQGWFMLDFISEDYRARMEESRPRDGSVTRENFARLSVDQAEIHLSVRLVNVMEFLKPTLGAVEMNMIKLKMDTNDFNYNLRCVVKYGEKQMLTQTFPGVVNITFGPDECFFRFPVRDMYTPIKIEVWNVPLPALGASSRPLKLMGSASVGLNDLIELEASAVFNHPHLAEPARLEPVKLVIKDSKGKKQGSLRLAMHFKENLLGGSLSTHANPTRHSSKPFSVANLRHEVQRSMAIFNSFTSVFGAMDYVLNWKNPPTSALSLAILVLACVLEFWTSRVLAVFPLLALIYIIQQHSDRTYGRFASKLLQKSGVGEKDTKARLLVTVIAGRNLIAMDSTGTSDPMVHVSIVNVPASKPVETKLGRTRTIYKTLNPDWSGSIIGFKASQGSSLIQWRSSRDGTRVPAIETFISREALSKPELQVRVVGTRGITRSNLPNERHKGDTGFQVTTRIVPFALLHSQRQNIQSMRAKNSDTFGADLASGRSRRPSRAGLRIMGRRRSSVTSANGEDADLEAFRDCLDGNEADEEPGRSRLDSINSEAMTSSTVSSMGMPYDLYRGISIGGASLRQQQHSAAELSWLPSVERLDNEQALASQDRLQRETAYSPLDKKLLHDIVRQQESQLPRPVSTRISRAFLNPMWNEQMRIGRDFRLDQADALAITFSSSTKPDRHKSASMSDVAYAFIPLKLLAEAGNDVCVNQWFPLEVFEEEDGSGAHAMAAGDDERNRDGDIVDDGEAGLTRWRIVGEILLSLSLRGIQETFRDPKLAAEGLPGGEASVPRSGSGRARSDMARIASAPSSSSRLAAADDANGPDPVGADDEAMEVTTAKERVMSAEPWSNMETTLVFDVFDEDNFTHRDFIGRACIPLSSIVADDSINEQPIMERWVPLGLRFDSSKADRQLWSCAQGRRYPTASRSRVSKVGSRTPRANRASLSSSLFSKSPFAKLRRSLHESAMAKTEDDDDDDDGEGDSNGDAAEADEDTLSWSAGGERESVGSADIGKRISSRLHAMIARKGSEERASSQIESLDSLDSAMQRTNSDAQSQFDSGTSVIEDEEPRVMTQANTDLNFGWQQQGPPFGEILVRAQLLLPDPGAEEAYRAAEEAKKADKGGIIEQSRLVFKNLQIFQDHLFGVNNTLEQFKNLFNWTHPRKTHFLMKLMTALLILFLVVPSRFVVLFVGIFMFTERFRPLGVMVIKFKHLMALVPTNDDLVELYTNGPLLGALGYSKGGSANDFITDNTHVESAESSKKTTASGRLYQNVRDRALNLGGIRSQVLQNRAREAQESKYIISESDCKAFGHLRILQRARSKQWRRYYFAIAHHQLLFWLEKDDMLVRVAQGGFGELVEVSPVHPRSPDAAYLIKKGVSGGTLECTFVIEHPERYKLRAEDARAEDGSSLDPDGEDLLAQTSKALSEFSQNQFGKRVRTYLVANNIDKRDFWIQNLRTHCLQNQNLARAKVTSLL